MMDRVLLTGHAVRDVIARDASIAAARAGWLGRMARGLGLFDLLDGIYDDHKEVELAIYRAHHARTVAAASPLALDLLAHEGFDVAEVVSRLTPRAEWRRWVTGQLPPVIGPFGRWSMGAAHARPEDADEIDLFLHGGLVLREWGDSVGALGIRLSPAGLEVGARIGRVHLRTTEGVAMVTTAIPLPETVKAAAIGLPVDAVFGHPVLSGRGYVICDQYDRVPTAEDPREAWRIEFRADPSPWRPLWR